MKIEAGKYYRTREGARVGPAKRDLAHVYADQGFVWRIGELTYRDDGTCVWEPDDDDIVAEWGAATPKFQPGDRVRCLQTSGSFTRGKVYTVRSAYDDRIRICEDDKGSVTNGWLAEKFEYAPAADSTFKPGDKIRWKGSTCGSYTNGRVYEIVRWDDGDGAMLIVTDDDESLPDKACHHWDPEVLAEKFERVDTAAQDTTTTDNPCIRTVTRREVVPGRLLLADGASIEITKVSTGHSGTYVLISGYAFTATALREAATAFNEIADALDEARQ